jgi:hypothetical protein
LGWGVFFIVAGSIPLLVQAGVLDPERVRQVWQLWPLILIGIGLGLILQRTRLAALGGLVVAATFGILVGGWFAVGFAPGAGFGACGIGGGSANTPFPTQSGSLGAGGKVVLDLSCGDAAIAPGPGDAWAVAGSSDDGTPPDITSGAGNLRVESPNRSGIGIGRAADWQVTLPLESQLDLDLSANAGSLDANLQGMRITNLSGSVNAGSATINMIQVTGLSSIDLSANAGSLKLTLPLPQGTINGSISANAGSVAVCVPTEVGLRITSSTSLGSNDFEDAGLTKAGDTWVRPALVASPNQIVLNVSANLGSVSLNPEDGCD